jgi:thioredoxin-like negative regulator of GroEL
MTPLLSQEFFESLIKRATNDADTFEPIVIIRFTATWCGPCKRIDTNVLLSLSDRIKWYVCDLDENDYTPGYCGVKTIPCFLAIVNGVPQPLFQSSDTMKVAEWIKGGFKQ